MLGFLIKELSEGVISDAESLIKADFAVKKYDGKPNVRHREGFIRGHVF